MKKVSKFSFNVMRNIRNSDEFKSISSATMALSDELQALQIKAVALSHVLQYKNLKIADMLGYAEEEDFKEFYNQAVKANDYFHAYSKSSDCSEDICDDLADILSHVDLPDEEESE